LQANSVNRLHITSIETVLNEDGGDYNFRVEGNTDQNLLFVDAGADRVGIGITNPSDKLHVYGDEPTIKIHRDNNADPASLEFAGSGGTTGAKVQYEATVNDLSFHTYGTSLTEAMRIDASGNVGIGTASPTQKLDVRGAIRILPSSGDALLQLTDDGTTNAYIRLIDGTQKLSIGDDTTTSIFTVDLSSENVGIGTASPSQKLHVQGSLRVTGAYYDSNNVAGTSDQVLISTGSATNWVDLDEISGVTGSGTTNKLPLWNGTNSLTNSRVSQTASSIEILGASGLGYSRLLLKPDTGDSLSLLELSHGPDPNNASVVVYGRGDTNYATINSLSRGTGVTKPINFDIDSDEKMRIDTSGNVGIGTTSPTSLLHIDTGANSAANFKLGANRTVANAAVGQIIGDWNGTVVSKIALKTGDDTTNKDNGEIAFEVAAAGTTAEAMRIDSSGNVGIGTTNPSQLLHILDGSAVSGTPYANGSMLIEGHSTIGLNLYGNDSSSQHILFGSPSDNTGGAIQYKYDGFGSGVPELRIGTGISNAIIIFASGVGNEKMRIDASGNIGIGTTSPNHKLKVIGETHSTHFITGEDWTAKTGGLHIGNDGLTTGAVSFYNSVDAGVSANIFRDSNIFYVGARAGQIEKGLAIDNIGNVGIGASPSFKLDVDGEVAADKYGFRSDSTAKWYYFDTFGGSNFIGRGASAYTSLYDTGTLSMVWKNGNVGIGTTSPSYPLDVVGYVNSSIGYRAGNYTILNETGNETSFGNSAYYGVSFKTNNAVRMKITNAGNVGIGTTTPGYKLEVNGDFAATSKSFIIDHPTKPNKRLRYASLEGPENGVYVRGRGDSDVIELPDYWTGLVHDDSITVQITAIGKNSEGGIRSYSVNDIIDNKVYVYTDSKDSIYEYFYNVNAERKDINKLQVEIDN